MGRQIASGVCVGFALLSALAAAARAGGCSSSGSCCGCGGSCQRCCQPPPDSNYNPADVDPETRRRAEAEARKKAMADLRAARAVGPSAEAVAARQKLTLAGADLAAAEAACLDRLAVDPAYQRAVDARAAAAAKVRELAADLAADFAAGGAQGPDATGRARADYDAAVFELADATRRLGNLRQAALTADPAVTVARGQARLTHERSAPIVDADAHARADAVRSAYQAYQVAAQPSKPAAPSQSAPRRQFGFPAPRRVR